MSQTDFQGCPTREQITAFLRGVAADGDADIIVAHIDGCPHCADLTHLLADQSDTVMRLLERMDGDATQEPAFQAIKRRLLSQAAPSMTPLELPLTLGQYELLELVGQGGMGRVFRAMHRHLKRPVAIKLLTDERLQDPDSVARFYREMEALGKFDHPNVVRATDAAVVDELQFLVMDYVEGLSCSQLQTRIDRLKAADACEIIRQAAIGLQAAHEQSLVHCDLKPSNLILTPGGVVKILDLGLARFCHDGAANAAGIMGTPDYMAPEQWRPGEIVDIRTDVYGLGCTLYKLLCGTVPFEPLALSADAKMSAHFDAIPPAPTTIRRDIPAELDSIIGRALAKQRHERFAEPKDLAAALAPFCENADLPRLMECAVNAETDTVRILDLTNTLDGRPLQVPSRARRTNRVGLTMLAVGLAFLVCWLVYASTRTTGAGWSPISLTGDRSLLSLDVGASSKSIEYAGQQALSIQSNKTAHVPLGRATQVPFRLRTSIVSGFEGSPGIYLGMASRTIGGRNVRSYQSVTVRQTPGSPKALIEWAFEEDHPNKLAFLRQILKPAWPVVIDPDRAAQTLEIAVANRGLTISWNGQAVATHQHSDWGIVLPESADRGDYGLIAGHGSFIFSSFAIHSNEEETTQHGN